MPEKPPVAEGVWEMELGCGLAGGCCVGEYIPAMWLSATWKAVTRYKHVLTNGIGSFRRRTMRRMEVRVRVTSATQEGA